jgi:hypothetical protein
VTFESEVSPSLTRHTSGVSGWDQSVTVDDVYDWDKSTAMLAAQAPAQLVCWVRRTSCFTANSTRASWTSPR